MKEGWKEVPLECAIDNLRTGLNPRVHFKLNTPDATGYYVTVRELKGWTFEVDDKTDRINQAAVKRINERSNLLVGDVLYSGTGTIGNTAIVQEEPSWWNIKEGVYAITPKSDLLESRFLIYVLKKLKDLIVSKSSGTTIKSIPMKELRKIEIPLPSLPEQQRIVEYLDSTFAEIDALKAKAAEEVANAKAMFDAALREEMTPKEGWEEKKLKEFAKYSIGLTYKPSDVSEYGTIVLRSANIQDDKLDLTDLVRVNCKIKDSLYVDENDILMCSRNGSARLVGKVALLPNMKEKMTYGTFMMVIKSEYNDYLFYFFKSDIFRNQIKHGEANMINQITRYMLDEVYVGLPSIEIQQRIVARLDTLRTLVTSLEQKYSKIATECDALKQAILKETFE